MNPILLKPEADNRSQLVVRGRPVASPTFREYARMKPGLLDLVRESLERLRRTHDVVVVPFIAESLVPAEDSLNLEDLERANGPALLEVAVAWLPRIANFDDLEPLAREPGVRVRFVCRPAEVENADLIVLPGSKNTAEDLAWLRDAGLADAVTAAASAGRPVVGICGGYQMLGLAVHDPDGVESSAATTAGVR